MQKRIRRMASLLPLMLLMAVPLFCSCSETDEEESSEFANWQEKNETYWNNIYATATANADGQWKIIRTWSKDDGAALTSQDYIVVHVEKAGKGTESPLYSDSVRVHYAGWLIPSPSYPEGYAFDKSYSDSSLDPSVSKPAEYALSLTGLRDGFRTALLHMHVGDRWTVYMPYSLAYGEEGYGSIPGYSVLIFDMNLVAFYRPGAVIPEWKSKSRRFLDEQ